MKRRREFTEIIEKQNQINKEIKEKINKAQEKWNELKVIGQ